MIVHEINDPELIKKVLCDTEIYRCISDDDSPVAEQFEPPINADIQYVAGFVDGDIMALMLYHNTEDRLNCHIQVLPQYRKQYAEKFAQMALHFGRAKNAIIYAEIPECFQNVKRFAESFGFKEIGKTDNGRRINGIVHDVAVMRLHNGSC